MSQRLPTRVRPAILATLVLVLAACTAPADETVAETEQAQPTETTMATESPAETEEEAADDDAAVLVADSDLGEILTDADGMTIYYFANDTEGTSNCEGDCLANWPPVEADGSPAGGEGVEAELGTITRDDGTEQLTVNGFPAYYFAGDEAAGDTNGQAVGDVWWVFGPDGEPIEE